MGGPLEGIKVVEMGVWVAGPAAGGILADWGADVVKIEPPGVGDPARLFEKMLGGDLPFKYNALFRPQRSSPCNVPGHGLGSIPEAVDGIHAGKAVSQRTIDVLGKHNLMTRIGTMAYLLRGFCGAPRTIGIPCGWCRGYTTLVRRT